MTVTDGDQIRNLLGIYCERMDAGDFDGIGELFAGGRMADEHGTVIATGADEVAALYHRGTQLYDGSPRTKHLVLDTVLAVDGDTAEARSSYLVLQAIDGVLPLQAIITGRYVDRFERDPAAPEAGWRWAERRFAADLLGDLSHHLTYTL